MKIFMEHLQKLALDKKQLDIFRAGGSSGTIAKAMSAYDKDFSDAIYGIEDDGRYVTESRLKKC
jgi:hypothetical protein